MADERDDWRRGRDRARYGEWRRVDDDRDRYGRSGYGRGENWRGSESENDWRRDRGDYGRGYQSREDWDRGREAERDLPRSRESYSREGFGREAWGRGYGDDPGRRAISGSAPGGAWGYDESWGRDPGFQRGWEPTGYGRAGYGRDQYGERAGYGNDRRQERGWWDRASDEMSSWFGDESAERRRQEDEREGDRGAVHHRGRGPRGYTRSDDRIREDVSDRLTDNPILDASDVEVTVSGAEVTLNGSVDSRYSKRLAEDLAHEVSGVRHVQNNLRIRQTGQERTSISGTSSGISEQGTTSDVGRMGGSGISGSSGTGNPSGSTSGNPSGSTSGIADQTPVGGTTSGSMSGTTPTRGTAGIADQTPTGGTTTSRTNPTR